MKKSIVCLSCRGRGTIRKYYKRQIFNDFCKACNAKGRVYVDDKSEKFERSKTMKDIPSMDKIRDLDWISFLKDKNIERRF